MFRSGEEMGKGECEVKRRGEGELYICGNNSTLARKASCVVGRKTKEKDSEEETSLVCLFGCYICYYP